uniref:Uncharacterized protein n=1 Tax=Mola mola TaxID=94237 RepID=A0A3Q3X9F6_MOLML
MDLKETVELVLSPTFNDESIQYLRTRYKKIQVHIQLLSGSEFRLLPKHHYIEHYLDLIVPESIAIVVEDELVLSDIPNLADALALLFGLMNALLLASPRNLIHTFTFIQKVLIGLDDGKPLKPCGLNLKMTC